MKRINFGEILKRREALTAEIKTTLVHDINKACEDLITFEGCFSTRKLRSSLKKMLNHTDHFERETFFREFMRFYNIAMAPDKRAKNVFHPSSLLDDCPRKLVYDLAKVPITDEVSRGVDGRLQRIFDIGTWSHIYFQNIFYMLGYLKQAEVPVINHERYIHGKADGVFHDKVFGEEVLLEIKTMNSFVYKKSIFKPLAKHEFQAGIYATELGIKKILYLYINKDTSEIKDFLRPVSEEQMSIAYPKMDLVISHVKDKTLPKRTCVTKMCEKALLCPFVTKCFADEK